MYDTGDFERPVTEDGNQAADYRPPFTRDYGRIIHSAGFRRQQGKTQVFPGHESDFFRNRLTHSLEVSQIAEGIADRINRVYKKELGDSYIDGRLCAAAGLVHDIGHPPFGHNGERALDAKMKSFGGFEGNAQTLRILTRLEKKVRYPEPVNGDDRAGMNLTYRTLAAILKYDKLIPNERDQGSKVAKGYYASEQFLVEKIKAKVLGGKSRPPTIGFKTIECAIMDLADDIAYSVYDLEDSLKAGFLTPASILSSDKKTFDDVAVEVSEKIKRPITGGDVLSTFVDIFGDMIPDADSDIGGSVGSFIHATKSSDKISRDAYRRTRLSSSLVHEFIKGIRFEYDQEFPALSTVCFTEEIHLKVEVLKLFTYNAIISSSRVKLGEYRGTQLVLDLFDALDDVSAKGYMLLPDDVRQHYERNKSDEASRARIVCDFIAGMTDRYAVEFWARLKSDGAESIFKSV